MVRICYNCFVRSAPFLPCPASHGRPPRGPSKSSKMFPSETFTFSPTVPPHKSFSCNTYGSPRKCCKQRAYTISKSFRCNTYKKQGGVMVKQLPPVKIAVLSFHPLMNRPLFHREKQS